MGAPNPLDGMAGLREVNPDMKVKIMKMRIFPIPLVAMTGMALFGHFATEVAAQNPSPSTNTPTVTEKASPSPASAVQLSYGVPEILKLVRAQVSDDTIVAFIGNSRRIYNLRATEIVYLREQGVSDRVLTTMLDRRQKAAEAQVASAAPQPGTLDATSAQYAPTIAPTVAPAVAQPSTTYVQTAPAYVPPSTVYVTSPSYVYSEPYPYYGGYWGFPFPAVSFGFGFRGGYHGGGYHGGGYRGGGYHGGGHR